VLTPELVADIHHEGGSLLGAGRGGDIEKAFPFFEKYDIDQVPAAFGAHCPAVSIVYCVCSVRCGARVCRACRCPAAPLGLGCSPPRLSLRGRAARGFPVPL
jgi:hypothetical protein